MSTSQFHFTRFVCLAAALFAVGASAQQIANGGNVSSGGFIGYVQDEIVVELTAGGASSAQQSLSDNAFAHMPEFAQAIVQANVVSAQRQFPAVVANSGHREDDRLTRIYKVKFRGNLETALRVFGSSANVVKAEPIGIHAVSAVPNDPYYDNPPPSFPYDQWHYRAPYGVNAQAAWDTETGDPNVVVGVMDTGVRYWHTDLGGPNAPWTPANPQTNGNIWVNGGEIPNNGVDDDGNGFVDDTIVYDF
ncbi:MAG TPA: hypothetical protein VLB27_09865 [candidate division Zixibacteria bacterium]|nr:hypothetical protein [candidate division Zixibacteria bacterium]